MKIELELDDKIVEGLLEAKKNAPDGSTLEMIATSLLASALVANGFTEPKDIVEQMLKTVRAKTGLSGVVDLLSTDSNKGILGVTVGPDGEVTPIDIDEIPEALRGLVDGFKSMMSGEETCTCPNCTARRATETKTYS